MKFAKYLASKAVPDWREYYLDYKRLKKLLEHHASYSDQSLAISSSSILPLLLTTGAAFEKAFQNGFKEEVDKVEFFCSTRLKQCRTRFQAITVQFFELKYPSTLPSKNSIKPKTIDMTDSHFNEHSAQCGSLNPRRQTTSRSRPASISEREDSLELLSSSLHDLAAVLKHLLDNFIPLNKLAVYKIFKKHDKLCSRLQALPNPPIPEKDLNFSQLLLQTAKRERKFYYRYKEDVAQLLGEVQHLQHELSRLLIRKRQEGIL